MYKVTKITAENFDIREVKKELRNKYKQIRRDMPKKNKYEKDSRIFLKLINLNEYKHCKTVITYVSTPIEVDTFMLIEQALKDGKNVAVPRCIPGTKNMVFYKIKSLSELSKGTFSVLEPDTQKCDELTEFDDSILIVPALVYDLSGYRLGYGGGYYDRFIGAYPDILKIGIVYCCCTVNELNRGRFDKPVDLLVTDKYIKTF